MASRKKAISKNSGVGSIWAGLRKNVIWLLIAVVVVVFAVESLNLFHGEVIKDFKVQPITVFGGGNNKWGSFNAWGVAPMGKDDILVVDQSGNRMILFDREGKFLKTWGKYGKGPMEFHEPSGMTWDDKGNAYVVDTWNGSIKGFNVQGKEVLNTVLVGNFYGPRGLGFDGHNFVIADTGSHRVELVSMAGNLIASWGGFGDHPGQFHGLMGVVSDHKGNYFVADTENNRVQWLDQDGKVLKVFKFKAAVPAVALDKEGRLFVSTGTGTGYSCIKAYNPKDGYLGDLKDDKGNLVPGDRGLAVTSDDVLIVAGGDRVALYQLPPATP